MTAAVVPTARGRRRPHLPRAVAPYVFVLPFVAIFVAFSVYPMLFTLRLSFTDWHGSGAARWVGLGNIDTQLFTAR